MIRICNTYIYILLSFISSSHPPSCKHSNPFSQLLRIKRCCSDNAYFIVISSQVANQYLCANTPSTSSQTHQSAKDNVRSFQRGIIAKPFSENFTMGLISLILPFHNSISQLVVIILKNYKTPITDLNTEKMLNILPITSYRRERNINNCLFYTSQHQPPVF